MSSRTYYRCRTCLAAFTTENPIPRAADGRLNAVCECDGNLERMGVVCGPVYGRETVLCKCDERCTFATGPNCDCQCGGKNHGAGMAAMEIGFKADGKVILRSCDEKARSRAEEFRKELGRCAEIAETLRNRLAILPQESRMKATMIHFRYAPVRSKAILSASHHHRMKVLREWSTSAAQFSSDTPTLSVQ